MKKNRLWLVFSLVIALSTLAIVSARNDLFMGALRKRYTPVTEISKPFIDWSRETIKSAPYQIQRNLLCGEGGYTVTNTSDPPFAPLNPHEKGIVLGKFTITTRNCELPIRTVWFDWRTRQFLNEAFHVTLASIEAYPMDHLGENDFMYRYAHSLNECMDNPDVDIAGRGNIRAYRVPLSPFRNRTTVPPNTAVQFGVKADFRPKRNEFAEAEGMGTEPLYIVAVDRAFGAIPIGNPLDLQTILFNPPNSPITETCH